MAYSLKGRTYIFYNSDASFFVGNSDVRVKSHKFGAALQCSVIKVISINRLHYTITDLRDRFSQSRVFRYLYTSYLTVVPNHNRWQGEFRGGIVHLCLNTKLLNVRYIWESYGPGVGTIYGSIGPCIRDCL